MFFLRQFYLHSDVTLFSWLDYLLEVKGKTQHVSLDWT